MKKAKNKMWQLFADTGGTFTDILAVDPQGTTRRMKVLSNSSLRGVIEKVEGPKQLRVSLDGDYVDDFFQGYELEVLASGKGSRIAKYSACERMITLEKAVVREEMQTCAFQIKSQEEPPVLAARILTKLRLDQKLPEFKMRIATTRGTNALLERRGAKVAFFVTKGFKDLLEIGNQQRPELFDLNIRKPFPLYTEVYEVDERISASGKVLNALNANVNTTLLKKLKSKGFDSAAICFLHSYVNPIHEHKFANLLKASGIPCVSTSSELAPLVRVLPRAQTAVVDAYLAPIMNAYLDKINEHVSKGDLQIMTSAGGLKSRAQYRAKDSLLSGPAGGVVGATHKAITCGYKKIIAFDMGGTSTDVSRFDGDYNYTFDHKVADAQLIASTLKIETVAAGGGSICGFDGERLYVGPESAGASPGPACYGMGDRLTITDVNLLLGRMDPALFGIPVDRERSLRILRALCREIGRATRKAVDETQVLIGFLNIANERMADAIRKISIREGYDPSTYALVAFGGAGGQSACDIAERLGMRRILYPSDAGLLSAYGLKEAVIEEIAERQVLQAWQKWTSKLAAAFDQLTRQARRKLKAQGLDDAQITIRKRLLYLRLSGQDATIELEWKGESSTSTQRRFARRFKDLFGYYPAGKEVECESMRVIASSKSRRKRRVVFPQKGMKAKATGRMRVQTESGTRMHPVYNRLHLKPGDQLLGPSIVQDQYATIVIEKGWKALVGSENSMELIKVVKKKTQHGLAPEIVQRELYTHRFYGLVDEMGLLLRRTSLSTNIKERLDFSCALLSGDGHLIVNAPHIPVHLGAIGFCVRSVIAEFELEQGDMIITNHPHYGGSHLPDVTVIAPVYHQGKRIAFVANRAHHAEIGGTRPGSVVPLASNLAEEGVVIAPTYLFKAGKANYEAVEEVLRDSSYPSRNPTDNLIDIQAQVASNIRGQEILLNMCGEFGRDEVVKYMIELEDMAAKSVKDKIEKLNAFTAKTHLDDGSLIQLEVKRSRLGLLIDFAGSCDVHPGNLNAPPAVVYSSIVYALRCWVNADIPLNEGLLRHVRIDLPEGMLNPLFDSDPSKCPAVVAGNVETSQKIANLFFTGLGICAESQGTMNNVIFGNDEFSYYETLCGGSGAGPGFVGANGVQCHMTNTAITDPEILEYRYPVRLEEFAIRSGSGGSGKFRGGNGIERRFTFLNRVSLSLLTQNRRVGASGLSGGGRGKRGQQFLLKKGRRHRLESISECEVSPGDQLLIQTPGGGGYGSEQRKKHFRP